MDYEQINKVPALPPEIKQAVDDDKLVVFVGAGVSRLYGCMGWGQLAAKLVTKCGEVDSGGRPSLNYRAQEALSQYSDHKKTITICYEFLADMGEKEAFFKELEAALTPGPAPRNCAGIYDELIALRGLLVTTNADKYLDQKFRPERIVYRPEDFTDIRPERNKLYHIHGSIRDQSSLVFTVPRYLAQYRERSPVRTFLSQIFTGDYVVLFTGYGAGEFELLDFLMEKAARGERVERKHFLLRGFYSGEDSLLRFEQYYHDSMGITVVGFEKDENGHAQLVAVLRQWNQEINLTSTYTYDTFKELDAAVEYYE